MRVADLNAAGRDILRLNVGGQSMQASRSILTFVKGSTLEAMFSGRHPITTLDNGEHFIDRNPKIFTMILDYLRNGCRIPPIEDTYKRQSFEMELDYWGIESQKVKKID